MALFESEEKENLCNELDILVKRSFIPMDIPEYVSQNINQNFEVRPYQLEAFARFRYYLNDKTMRKNPTQLLFEMATGSGKTLIMVMCILELYKQGYRNFIFFVNTDTIIQKTKDNFLNNLSRKYLLNEKIIIDFREVFIEEVNNFESNDHDNIHIYFTTIQGLHSNLSAVRENNISYETFRDKKIVLISDEAHHINAQTKKGANKEEFNITSWETTIYNIFRSNVDNIMLEFTATAELNNPEIRNKYIDKLLFKYDLARFRKDRYSKEVELLQADMSTMDRALLAVVLSQYRKKVYNEYASNLGGDQFIKPVILMKSKTIKESNDFEAEFHQKIKNLSVNDIELLWRNTSIKVMQEKVIPFFNKINFKLENIVIEIQNDFSSQYCLSVNSKDDASDKQLAVNDLENPKNYYRVIFAVDKLNEGWDVLNLFDIVRLYETRDSKGTKPGKTTVAEAQLIGRGARYFPFQINELQDKYKRKYDDERENPLKILEELHYHSKYDNRYISELQIALRDIGMMDEKKPKEITQNVKSTFLETEIYKNSVLWANKKKRRGDGKELNYKIPTIIEQHTASIATGKTYQRTAFENKLEPELQITSENWYFVDKKEDKRKLIFQPHIIRSAMQTIPFYYFDNLKKYFPSIKTWSDILQYIQDVVVKVTGAANDIKSLNNKEFLQEQYRIVKQVLFDIANNIQNTYGEYYGTTEFYPVKLRDVVVNKKINISITSEGEKGISMKDTKNLELRADLSKPEFDWYVYDDFHGTDEEKFLVKFVEEQMPRLIEKYKVVYLIRLEKSLKLYNFKDGAGYEPDFILFLCEDDKKMPEIQYHIYIEPKGQHLIDKDKWKEEFLLQITKEGKPTGLESFENKEFRLVGLPFFNNQQQYKKIFIDDFKNYC